MNGGNLFASVRQFLESERTLKIKNLAMMDLKLSEIKDLFSESEEQHSSEIENSVKKILSGLKIERTVSIPTALYLILLKTFFSMLEDTFLGL